MININSNLFITKISLNKEKIPDFNIYPFNLNIIKDFDELKLNSPVTFFVGENGSGKSTFIEAIAVAIGLNPEGGSQNFNFYTNQTHSELYKYITLSKSKKPRTKYFLRAESFYNVASEVEKIAQSSGDDMYNSYGGNLHECSHGESFIKLIQNRFYDNGIYILDEPEAALSPQRQLSLLCLIDDLVKNGSQFIIATHSPILISYRNGEILNLDNNFQKLSYKDTDIYKTYKMYLDNPDGMQEKLFN